MLPVAVLVAAFVANVFELGRSGSDAAVIPAAAPRYRAQMEELPVALQRPRRRSWPAE